MTITEFRKNIAAATEKVRQDVAPMLLTQGNKEPLVLMPLSQLSSYEETEYLLRSLSNRERLLSSVERIRSGTAKYVTKTIEELEAMAEEADAGKI